MTNIDRSLLTALTTQLCDALDALTDALNEVREELRALQAEPPPFTAREHVLVPPPPLPGPSL